MSRISPTLHPACPAAQRLLHMASTRPALRAHACRRQPYWRLPGPASPPQCMFMSPARIMQAGELAAHSETRMKEIQQEISSIDQELVRRPRSLQ